MSLGTEIAVAVAATAGIVIGGIASAIAYQMRFGEHEPVTSYDQGIPRHPAPVDLEGLLRSAFLEGRLSSATALGLQGRRNDEVAWIASRTRQQFMASRGDAR